MLLRKFLYFSPYSMIKIYLQNISGPRMYPLSEIIIFLWYCVIFTTSIIDILKKKLVIHEYISFITYYRKIKQNQLPYFSNLSTMRLVAIINLYCYCETMSGNKNVKNIYLKLLLNWLNTCIIVRIESCNLNNCNIS